MVCAVYQVLCDKFPRTRNLKHGAVDSADFHEEKKIDLPELHEEKKDRFTGIPRRKKDQFDEISR